MFVVCSWFVARCVLCVFVVCCVLLGVRCLLFVVWRLLSYDVCCLLFAECCLLFADLTVVVLVRVVCCLQVV